MDLKREMQEYALYARDYRNRRDVWNAVMAMLHRWDYWESDEERRIIFERIQKESVESPALYPVRSDMQNNVYRAWQRERAMGKDPVFEAYVRARR